LKLQKGGSSNWAVGTRLHHRQFLCPFVSPSLGCLSAELIWKVGKNECSPYKALSPSADPSLNGESIRALLCSSVNVPIPACLTDFKKDFNQIINCKIESTDSIPYVEILRPPKLKSTRQQEKQLWARYIFYFLAAVVRRLLWK